MERLQQTAITAAAIGAVIVAAGVVISLQSQTNKTGQAKTNISAAPIQPVSKPAMPVQEEFFFEEGAVLEEEFDLSAHGEPLFNPELTPTKNPDLVDEDSGDTETSDDEGPDEDAQGENGKEADSIESGEAAQLAEARNE